jgi:hypothetical protein
MEQLQLQRLSEWTLKHDQKYIAYSAINEVYWWCRWWCVMGRNEMLDSVLDVKSGTARLTMNEQSTATFSSQIHQRRWHWWPKLVHPQGCCQATSKTTTVTTEQWVSSMSNLWTTILNGMEQSSSMSILPIKSRVQWARTSVYCTTWNKLVNNCRKLFHLCQSLKKFVTIHSISRTTCEHDPVETAADHLSSQRCDIPTSPNYRVGSGLMVWSCDKDIHSPASIVRRLTHLFE